MVTTSQLKDKYLKDLYSYRQLHNYHYGKRHYGYVIGVVNASEIVDQGFWNNENLIQQFDVERKSSGSKFFDTITDVAVDNNVNKMIQKASEESVGTVIFYVPEDGDSIMADMIFHNKSKNRNLDKLSMSVGGNFLKMELKTVSLHQGKQSYEDAITFGVGDFSFFKESVIGKKMELFFNLEEEKNLEPGEPSDFLSLKFDLSIPLVDVASVEYIINGDKWSDNDKNNILPAIEKGLELSSEQARQDGKSAEIALFKKRAKWISWTVAIVLLIILVNCFPDMEGGFAFLLLVATVAIGMSGKFIGNKVNEEKEKTLSEERATLSERKQELESRLQEVYLSANISENVSAADN